MTPEIIGLSSALDWIIYWFIIIKALYQCKIFFVEFCTSAYVILKMIMCDEDDP